MTTTEQRLQRVYARIPGVTCKGLCHDSCTSIDMTDVERAKLAERGVTIPPRRTVLELTAEALRTGGEVAACPALSALGACRVYDVRPFICRLFGAARGLRCSHGCEPERALSGVEVGELMRELDQIDADARRRAP